MLATLCCCGRASSGQQSVEDKIEVHDGIPFEDGHDSLQPGAWQEGEERSAPQSKKADTELLEVEVIRGDDIEQGLDAMQLQVEEAMRTAAEETLQTMTKDGSKMTPPALAASNMPEKEVAPKALGKTLLEEMRPASKPGVVFSSVLPTYNGKEEQDSSGHITSRSLVTTANIGGSNPEFTIAVERAAGASLGLNLDALDGTSLIISSVKAGPIRLYNETVEDDLQLQPGDSIVGVNGSQGSAEALLERLKTDLALELTIRRPKVFSISIPRAYGPLGLQVEHAPSGTSLLVKMVNPGLIKDWNLAHRGQGIKRRDRVITVNGLQGNPAELMANMKMAAVQGDRLEITVGRYY